MLIKLISALSFYFPFAKATLEKTRNLYHMYLHHRTCVVQYCAYPLLPATDITNRVHCLGLHISESCHNHTGAQHLEIKSSEGYPRIYPVQVRERDVHVFLISLCT